MEFNNFIFNLLDLINKSSANINITLKLQKSYLVDILVSIDNDVIIDTSIDSSFLPKEEKKMNKIFNIISEYC